MEMIFITTLIESVLVLILLAVPFIVTQLVRRKRHSGSVWKKELVSAIEAKAVVLAIEQTGLYIGQQPQVKMQIQVIPERGRNFIAETNEVLSVFDMATIRSGSTVRVKYNPENMREIALIKS